MAFAQEKKDDASSQWASHRFGYEPFHKSVLERRVPKTPWYHGDGAALTTLLIVQIVTGVTMTLYYMNAADQAYDSVQFITGQLSMGWLVRGIHYWTAGTMVVVGPREMYPEGNLIERSMPKEEWWFWWYSSLIAKLPPYLSSQFLVLFPVVLFFGLLLLPFLDRGTNRGWRKRPFWGLFVLVCVISLLWLSDLRMRSPWTGWPDETLPPVPEHVVLTEKSELGRQRYTTYGCNSCHAISSRGARVGPDLARVNQVHSRQWLHEFVLAPPEDVAMPAYRGRITDEDLDLVVEFVLVAQTFHLE